MADTYTEVRSADGTLVSYTTPYGPSGEKTIPAGGRLFNEITQRIADNDPTLTILPPAPTPEPSYIEERTRAYGPIRDQLDMQYWDGVDGTTIWADHIAAVKAAHPKSA